MSHQRTMSSLDHREGKIESEKMSDKQKKGAAVIRSLSLEQLGGGSDNWQLGGIWEGTERRYFEPGDESLRCFG